jgi:hypothetical protein
MKLEITLTTDEWAALRSVPGASQQQRMKWLVKFWQAVCDEKSAREAKEAQSVHPGAALNAVFAQAAADGILPATIEDATARPAHWQEQIEQLPGYVAMVAPIVEVSREELAKEYPE